MKKIVWILLITLVFILLYGCVDKIQEENNDDAVEENKVEVDKIKELLSSMTIEEKIGQLLIVGMEGTTVDENIRGLITNNYVGGIIFFASNVESLSGVVNLTNELKSLNVDNKCPLFISVDEEGGIVSRVPSEFKRLPSSSYIASFNNKEICYEVGEIIANQLKTMGYNMDYAPVLDILSNPKNTVIGNRAFGDNADIVSNLSISTMKGIQDNGVISVVKHFPGHGDTYVDSHYGLPLVEKSLSELKELELIPFENAIKNGADSIMVSHILLSNVDSENPASMSKRVITDILRDNMGFDGVVMTDDMTMGAIMENYDIGEASVKSINAGTDIVLVCHGYDNGIKALNAIKDAVDNGIISEERVNESVYRILSLKEKYNLNDNNIEMTDNVSEINNRINNLFE